MPKIFNIADTEIALGESKVVCLDVGKLYDYTEMHIHLKVLRGRKDGPILFVSSTIHGDELNGIEIIKCLLKHKSMKHLRGTLIVAPIVNVFGFANCSRYLPDRRDLNRSFPGTKKGSMASRVAYTFMQEVVKKSTHGIDLHTGSNHRTNLPQIRACLEHLPTKRLARVFGAPVILNSELKDGSLREAARDMKMPMLLYEAGEALRFDPFAIKCGVKGILAVMSEIGMLNKSDVAKTIRGSTKSFIAKASHWVRAPHGGTIRLKKSLGDMVKRSEIVAHITDPFGDERVAVRAKAKGIIIGATNLPLVNRGDAIFHVATFKDPKIVEEDIDQLEDFSNTY